MSTAAVVVPLIGAEVVDVPTGMLAVVRDVLAGKVWLQRPTGGVEWTRHPGDVRLASTEGPAS